MRISRLTGRITAALVAGLCGATGAAEPVSIAHLTIKGSFADRPSAAGIFGQSQQILLDSIETLDTIAFDDEFAGVMIRLKDASLTTSQIEELGQAIMRVRAEGKRVHLFAEGYGTSELLLGSFADEIIIQQGGGVSLPGLFMEEMYLADTLEWIGIKADMVQVGDFKGANEQMTRSEPSADWNQNINHLLDSMYENMRSILKAGRDLDDAELDRAMEVTWWANGSEAIEVGLIDAEVDLPDLAAHLAQTYDTEITWVAEPYDLSSNSVDLSNPFALFGSMFNSPKRDPIRDPTIAVLHISGTIIDGDSSEGGLFGSTSVGSRTIRNAIKQIMDEEMIRGVVLRIDSPGGSAIASEVMWQGLHKLAAEKPLWVSVGSMAASGGYYVLSAGDRVYVNPSSIVGSIGVVGGKYAMGGLYDKLKISVVERSRGPAASLASSTTPWTPDQLDAVRQKMTNTYDLFTSRVTAGRPGIDLSRTAEGRLFTGADAVKLKMADELGGLDDAINDLAADLGMGTLEIVHFPAPATMEELLKQMFGGMVQAPGLNGQRAAMVQSLAEVLGERRFESVRQSLQGLMLLRDEPVLLLSPRAIHFR